jgi:hypothetical protein
MTLRGSSRVTSALKFRLWAVALFLLTSCAAPPVAHFRASSDNETAGRGYVLLSLGPANEPRGVIHYNLVIRKVPNGAETSVLFTKGVMLWEPTPVDYMDAGLPGAVYHVSLPAGQYEVLRYRVFRPQALSPDFSDRFAVEPNKTTYLGRFRVGLSRVDAIPAAFGERVNRYDADKAIALRRFAADLAAYPLIEAPQ